MNKAKKTILGGLAFLATMSLAQAQVDYSTVSTSVGSEMTAIVALVLATAILGIPVFAALNGMGVIKKAAKVFLGR